MISKDKQYVTRGGLEVRIYATDGLGEYPVHGAYWVHGNWVNTSWTLDGLYSSDLSSSKMDLVEVKPRHQRTVWINCYPGGNNDCSHNKLEDANRHAGPARIACIQVELDFAEGEGLK